MELKTKTAKRLKEIEDGFRNPNTIFATPEEYKQKHIIANTPIWLRLYFEKEGIINFNNELKEIVQRIAKDRDNKYGITEILILIQEIDRVLRNETKYLKTKIQKKHYRI